MLHEREARVQEPARSDADRPATPAPAPPLDAARILALQRGCGNAAVARMLSVGRDEGEPAVPEEEPIDGADDQHEPEPVDAPEEEEEEGDEAEELGRVTEPVGGGHHVVLQPVDGELRLGVASDFTQAQHIVGQLRGAGRAITGAQHARVRVIDTEIQTLQDDADDALEEARRWRKIAARLRNVVTIGYRPDRYRRLLNRIDKRHRRYPAYLAAIAQSRRARVAYIDATTAAVRAAKDAILELWAIGADFLPTHLMPLGEVFRDRAFTGDRTAYTYHQGTQGDPIPIHWYKAPLSYPRLQLPDGTIVKFPDDVHVPKSPGAPALDISVSDPPVEGWLIQKVAHNDDREGQRDLNLRLNASGVTVEKRGMFVSPPVGAAHSFDGDHVKDLGFDGRDRHDNYWPLDATINRRAFTGFNSAYVVNYLDAAGRGHARAIGGLIGKWFEVTDFLADDAPPVPQIPDAAKGGTPNT